MVKFLFVFIILASFVCYDEEGKEKKLKESGFQALKSSDSIIVGAAQPQYYLDSLKGKRIGLVVNQTSLVGNKHLLDFLIEKKINIKKVFAPEHGFRGNIDRGDEVKNETDTKTGVPVVSLFGKNRKPTEEQLKDLDILIFDIQDVGVRFYTYISTMHEIMEACARNNKKLFVFDRPNPLGDYIDGPVRQEGFKSFVGMHPIPIVHGLTIGELARMINGEKWLEGGKKCHLTVIKVANYKHSLFYHVPVKPSPNLTNDLSIRLYPSLCLFEATEISIGRGTEFPFQVIGYPDPLCGDSLFTPRDIEGMQMNPEQEGKLCYGVDLRKLEPEKVKFTLKYLIDFYNKFPDKQKFFKRSEWFNLLAGNNVLIEQVKAGKSENEIRETWKPELDKYRQMRKKYLLYDE
ncbi:MAG: DUF1343 domain-containing protein [Bacteroidales bacterium]